ncbi:MAG TPA: SDR family oxidoreductase [Pyrinomonadaceae bacterium]|nr:SDR family oxidoreductase [Pyrinomonadaceae bacterium]
MLFEQTIFLTGFPGFIGERLVERLAAANRQMLLLVQSHFVPSAVSKIENIAKITGTPLENFAVIEGDICQPGLGMSEEDLEFVRINSTHIFHLAAIYDLAVPREIAIKVNVEGTLHVNKLAGSMPNLARYSYISTCYVAGKRAGMIREDELEHNAGFRNFYEESKYLAECEVEKLKDSLSVTIFRPSVVVGDSKTGETAKYDGIYYLVQYLLKAPRLLSLINVGNEKVKLNLVPVDFIVDSIAELAFDREAEGKTLALADPDPNTTRELFDLIAQAAAGRGSAFDPPPSLVEWCLMLPFSPALTGLPHSGVPYFFLEQEYDTSVSAALLSKHGIRCPRFADYVKDLLDFVKMHPML